jgi:hypothetical protein
MATLALVLDAQNDSSERQRLSLKERLCEPRDARAIGEPRGERPTLEDLLRHRARMPAWTPMPARLGKRFGDRVALREFPELPSTASGSPAATTPPRVAGLSLQ